MTINTLSKHTESMRMSRSARKGFTLVELLVVIAIIGILTTIGVANFRASRIKARDASRKHDLEQISKSLEAYLNDYNQYPAHDADGRIVCKPATASSCNWGSVFSDDGNKTSYMVKLPSESNSRYRYMYVSTGSTFKLYTRLENENDPDIDSSINLSCETTGATGEENECNYVIGSTNATLP